MNNIKYALFLSSFVLVTGATASAMTVSPMEADFDPTGKGASVVYTVSNESDSPLTIEVTVEGRKTAVDGTEILDFSQEVQKNFAVFPGATIIGPKSKKGIRVVYLGPKDLTTEQNYRVDITQVPTQEQLHSNSGVAMFPKFHTSAFIHPKNVKADVKLIGSEADAKTIKLHFQNVGTQHRAVRKMALKISDESGAAVLIDHLTAANLITNFLAGESRDLVISRPLSVKGKNVTVSLETLE